MNQSSNPAPVSSLDPASPASQPGNSDGHTSKKRKGGASGRGVASLTPDQLAKKRANDREAQRAIRERTKATIETLERKIQELESQQPYQELQAVIRQKDAVQAENDEIRRRLASILSIIQPVVGAQGLTDLATAAQHNVQMSFAQQNNNLFQQSDQYIGGGPRQYQSHSPGLSSPQDSTHYAAPFHNDDQEAASENRVWTSSRDALNQQRDNLHRNMELNESGERLSFNFLLEGINAKHNHVPAAASTSPSQRQPYHSNTFPDQSQPVWAMLPKNCSPTCPLDGVLLNFLHTRQREAAQTGSSASSASMLSPAYPSVSSLLNPTSAPALNIDPISQLMTDIIVKFPNISNLPEQVATLFMMFLYMRWQIYPTQENYERLPEWLTPRPSQLFTAHPAWVDHIVWPRMRDKVVHNYLDYPFENWFLPFTSGLSVNWPYEPVDCLLSTGETGSTTINPVFERHIRRLENWSLGNQFAEAYPALADTATFKTSRFGSITNTGDNAGGSGGDLRGNANGNNTGNDSTVGTNHMSTSTALVDRALLSSNRGA